MISYQVGQDVVVALRILPLFNNLKKHEERKRVREKRVGYLSRVTEIVKSV